MKRLILLIVSFSLTSSCQREKRNSLTIAGTAQGTTYHITYLAGVESNYRQSIDSIFQTIDQSLSTYVPSSLISRINKNDSSVITDEYFLEVYNKSREVSIKTNGLFDITVAPIVNTYGFGFTKKEKITPALIDSLLPLVGYKKVQLAGNKIQKDNPAIMLDFNAIAQGYTVDVLARFLESKGISNYMVEVGGELKARGLNKNDSLWSVGIEQPVENATEGNTLNFKIRLKDKALATSGNYKKFYVEEGKKYSHIINPFTGYPAKNNLLSATVIAADCMTADAYATSFMVMGLENAKKFLQEHKELELEVIFIYDDNGVWKRYSSKKYEESGEMIF